MTLFVWLSNNYFSETNDNLNRIKSELGVIYKPHFIQNKGTIAGNLILIHGKTPQINYMQNTDIEN